MLKNNRDTIAARATPPGIGGVGVIRVSGPKILNIAHAILHYEPQPRFAHFGSFFGMSSQAVSSQAENNIIDQGIALYFAAPNSFTGEDVLELHGHGGQIVMERLLRRVLELGARLAKPGEFMLRAFLNHKLDLTQVEAVADLIHANSEQAASYAVQSLQGEFSRRIENLKLQLTNLRAQVEAAIDFVETQDVTQEIETLLPQQLTNILQQLRELKERTRQGVVVREGETLVIAGKTNVGKSSLFNYLSGKEHAIVTDVPGTTRDVLRAWIKLGGVTFNILDTAGFNVTPDVVEAEGIRRAEQELQNADHILWMEDVTNPAESTRELDRLLAEDANTKKPLMTIIYNKIDLTDEKSRIKHCKDNTTIYLSLKTGEGLDLLSKHLEASTVKHTEENGFSARQRHLDALERIDVALQKALHCVDITNQVELLAEELRVSQEILGEITGLVTSEDLLGKIFAEFCIGK